MDIKVRYDGKDQEDEKSTPFLEDVHSCAVRSKHGTWIYLEFGNDHILRLKVDADGRKPRIFSPERNVIEVDLMPAKEEPVSTG